MILAWGKSGSVGSLLKSTYVAMKGVGVVLCSSFATWNTGWGFNPWNLTFTSNLNFRLGCWSQVQVLYVFQKVYRCYV